MKRPIEVELDSQNDALLVSNEMRDFISISPPFLVRRGNMIFFMVLSMLGLLTWFIPYPEVVQGSARLLAMNSPKRVSAREEGRLEQLFVENGRFVQQGDILACLQSTANYHQVFALRKWITTLEQLIENHHFDKLLRTPVPVLNELGELQRDYSQFYISLKETTLLLSNGYYRKKQASIEKDLDYLVKLQESFHKQRQLQESNMELQEIDFEAKRKLAEEKVLAALEFNQEKSKKLDRQERWELMHSEQINLDISVHNKEKEALELRKSIFTLEQQFYADLLVLKSSLDDWIDRFVVKAPVDGKVLYFSFLKEKQWINGGQILFYVEPPQNQHYLEVMISQAGIGKIRDGQTVKVNMAGYPGNEFGTLNGHVSYISGIPGAADSFLIKVDLPRGLSTSYNKRIDFKNDLRGQAEIVTRNRQLGQRLLGNLMEIFTP